MNKLIKLSLSLILLTFNINCAEQIDEEISDESKDTLHFSKCNDEKKEDIIAVLVLGSQMKHANKKNDAPKIRNNNRDSHDADCLACYYCCGMFFCLF